MGIYSSSLAFSYTSPLIKHFHVSAAIYCEKSYDDKFLRRCDYFIDSQDKDIQCLINKEGTNLFVCFRGTDTIKDWRSNLNLNLIDIENSSKFHEGFYNSWNSVKNDIKDDIKESFDNHMDIQTVIFTGHSAGVVANLAAYDLHDLIKKEYNKNIEAVTFGAPKCCNEDFKRDFNKKKINCTRFVLKDDIITQFPVGKSYKHLGIPIFMRSSINEKTRCIFNFFGTLDEHNIENYVYEIKNLIE